MKRSRPAIQRSIVGVAAGALAFALGCSSTPAPRCRDATIGVREGGAGGVVASIRLRVDNIGEEPLPVRDVTYELFQDDRRVFEGVRSAQRTLNRYGTQEIELPAAWVPSPETPAPSSGSRYRVAGRMTYIVPGALAEVLFDAKLVRPTSSFSLEAAWRDE